MLGVLSYWLISVIGSEVVPVYSCVLLLSILLLFSAVLFVQLVSSNSIISNSENVLISVFLEVCNFVTPILIGFIKFYLAVHFHGLSF